MSTNNGVNMIMTPSDIIEFRKITKDKLDNRQLDDLQRNKLATIVDASEQLLEYAFMQTINTVTANDPKFSLPEYLGSDMFATKVLEAAKVDDTQTELFKEEPKTNVKEEIAVVVGDGYKEQINAIFKDPKLGLKEKIATSLKISAENHNKDYCAAFEELLQLTDDTGLVRRIFEMINKSTTDSVIITFLRLRDNFGLSEETAAKLLTACVREFHPTGSEYLINPPMDLVRTWYGNEKIKSLVSKLYDNVQVNLTDRTQSKPYFQLLHHIVTMISPEEQEKIAARKRKAEYKEKAYSDTK